MGEEGFKHIAVNVADDDDFVIRVGASESEPSSEPVVEQVAEPTVEPVVEQVAEPTAETAEVAEVAKAPSKAKVAAGEGQRRSRKDDGYHETTLEDLKGEKMPFAQRAVIIAAIICIIGAVVYYFAFMR